jgi:CRISPR-associated endonuclease/helicase Cas3
MMVMDMDTAEHLTQRLGRVNRFGEVESAVAVLVHEKNTAHADLTPAEHSTLDYLHSLPLQDGGVNVSCKTIFENPSPAEAQGKRPALTTFTERDLTLLSYTSVRHSKAKPDVDALLHGAEGSPAYVEVCWREELPVLLELSDDEREEWLSSYRVLAHERLRELNYEVSQVLGECRGAALLVESDGSTREIRIPDDLTTFDKKGKTRSAIARESLLVLPPGLAGLSSGMLAEEQNGNDVSATAERFRFIADDEKVRGVGREFSEDDFKAFLRQSKLTVKLRVGSEEVSLIHVAPKKERAGDTGTEWLDEHLAEVEQVVRDLCGKLDVPAELAEELVLAARMHDAGKKHPNWQKAFNGGKMSARAIAKLVGRTIRQSILAGLRHEFVSLFEMDGNVLAKQVVSAHHAWGRPHFPQRGYDPDRARSENAAMNLENMRSFAKLQRRHGVYGLAYLEAVLRAADAMASGSE